MGMVKALLFSLLLATPNQALEILDVEVDAAPDEDAVQLRELTELRPGMRYSPRLVRRAVVRLHQLGRFENVIVRAQKEAGGLVLLFELPPRTRLRNIRFEVDADVDEARMRSALGLRKGDRMLETDLGLLRERLLEVLERRGWRSPVVGLRLFKVDAVGRVDLEVKIQAGPRARIGGLEFVGRPRRPDWDLRRWVKTGPGDVLDLDRLERELNELEKDYRVGGFWDVSIAAPEVREVGSLRRDANQADVVVRIDAGPRVSVEVVGNRRVPRRALAEDLAEFEERGTTDAVMREIRDRLLDRFRERGHWRAQVRLRARDSVDDAERIVFVQVKEGPVGRIVDLSFPGASAFEVLELESQVRDFLRRSLESLTSQPGADPEQVEAIVGGSPAAEAPRRQPDPSPPNPDLIYVERAYRNAADALASLYRSAGHQQVVVGRPVVKERPDGYLEVSYPISEGIPWIIGRVRSIGNVALADERILDDASDARIKPGEPLAFDRLEEARRSIQARHANAGHLFARIKDDVLPGAGRGEGNVRSECSEKERRGASVCEVDVVFTVTQGPLVQTRNVIIRHRGATRDIIIRGELEVKEGEILRASDMDDTRENLLRVGVFDRVSVRPLEEDVVEASKDVLIDLEERNRYGLSVGAGFSTEEGFRVFTGFSDINVFGSAIRLQTNAKINFWPTALLVLYNEPVRTAVDTFYSSFSTFERFEYEISTGVSYPRIFGLPRGFGLGLDLVALRDLDPAFLEDTQSATLVAAYTGFRPRIWRARRPFSIQFRSGFERTNVTCNDDLSTDASLRGLACSDPTSADVVTGNQLIAGTNSYLSAGPRFSWDFRNDPLAPTAGAYFEVDGRLSKGLNEESPDLARVEGRMSFYFPVIPRVVLSTALLGGRIVPLEGGRLGVPVNRRFFAGGRTTIRGYQENTLLAQDVDLVRAPSLGVDGDTISETTPGEVGDPIGDISAGGLLFVALKTELVVQVFGPVGLAAFYDVGDLFEDGDFSFVTRTDTVEGTVSRSIAQGAGMGLRLATPVGPLALDVARPIAPRDEGFDSWQLHFSVGTF
ncbi:MAG: POTRA domain-containing protein [Myxococcota bacterium]